jgi:KDO2-lipid IV(A) lauroyltransferase
MQKFFRLARYGAEYLAFTPLTSILRLMSIDRASDICSKIARIIGPFMSVTRIAWRNLNFAYGDIDDNNKAKIIDELWNNFGRFIGEFPHIHKLSEQEIEDRVEIIGLEHISTLQRNHQPFLLFTGHFANWDFILRIANKLYPKFGVIYRRANNPFVNKVIHEWRNFPGINLIEKGPYGVRSLVKSMKAGHSIAMLVDQKMNDGIEVPFFGKKAMTAPAIARFALQFDYPIIPMQIVRVSGSYFKVILHPQLVIERTTDIEQDIFSVMKRINEMLEVWIRQHPGQWFWFHNRWGSDTK